MEEDDEVDYQSRLLKAMLHKAGKAAFTDKEQIDAEKRLAGVLGRTRQGVTKLLAAGVASCSMRADQRTTSWLFIAGAVLYGGCRFAAWMRRPE